MRCGPAAALRPCLCRHAAPTTAHITSCTGCMPYAPPGAADKRHLQNWRDWWRSGDEMTGCRLDACALLLHTEGASNIARVVAQRWLDSCVYLLQTEGIMTDKNGGATAIVWPAAGLTLVSSCCRQKHRKSCATVTVRLLCPSVADRGHHHDWRDWWNSRRGGCRLHQAVRDQKASGVLHRRSVWCLLQRTAHVRQREAAPTAHQFFCSQGGFVRQKAVFLTCWRTQPPVGWQQEQHQ